MSGVYVFLGPSLRLAEARALLPGATFLPPAAMGDLHALVQRRPRVVAIVDGFFEQTPAIWHKEILWALSRGVRVLGASSMGALRAAELHPFGMEGVGEVFAAFRDGVLEDDDEVAVAHAPAEDDFRPVSDAMVNLRAGLTAAEAAGVVSPGTHRALLAAGKALFYPLRSWAALHAAGVEAGLPAGELDALRAHVRRTRPDVKAADARALLRHVATTADGPPPAPRFVFEETHVWRRLARGEARRGAGPTQELLRERVGGEPGRELDRGALLLALVRREAERAGLEIDRLAVQRAAELLRRARGLVTAEATRAWLDEQGLDRAAFSRLAELEALAAAIAEHCADELDELWPLELARRGWRPDAERAALTAGASRD